MIALSTSTALMLYLVMTMAPLFALWAYYHFRDRRRKIVIEEKNLLICEFCHFCYLGDKGMVLSQCPQCQLYNKIEKK